MIEIIQNIISFLTNLITNTFSNTIGAFTNTVNTFVNNFNIRSDISSFVGSCINNFIPVPAGVALFTLSAPIWVLNNTIKVINTIKSYIPGMGGD